MVLVGACIALGSACAPWPLQSGAEDSARQGLVHMVEKSQDRIWPFRAALSHDPEGALASIYGLADVRRTSADGSWLLTDLRQDASGTALTLMTSASGETGGGLFYAQVSLRTCWTLVVAPDGSGIDTTSADCVGILVVGRLPEAMVEASAVALDDLTVRRHVDATDYPAVPCQCSSGELCECPGG